MGFRAMLWMAVGFSMTACSSAGGGSAPLSTSGKFATVDELLANPDVQMAVAYLPATPSAAAGSYYQGSTPADISGTWTTNVSGGSTGVFTEFGYTAATSGHFGGAITYQVTGPGLVDVPVETGTYDEADGTGSFLVGAGNDVTAFLQLNVTCLADQEHIREVSIDRFVYSATGLTQYVRSYVVLARDKPNGPWNCAPGPVGSGASTTPAVFVRE